MDRKERLRRLNERLDELEYADRYASLQAGLGDQFIRNYRKSKTERIDPGAWARLAAVLQTPVTHFIDLAAFDPMGESLNPEWHRWATAAALKYLHDHGISPQATVIADLTHAYYKVIAARFRGGDQLTEAQAMRLLASAEMRAEAQNLTDAASMRTRRRQKRRPRR